MTSQIKKNRVIALLLLRKPHIEISKVVKIASTTITEIRNSKEYAIHRDLIYQHIREYIENNIKVNDEFKNVGIN